MYYLFMIILQLFGMGERVLSRTNQTPSIIKRLPCDYRKRSRNNSPCIEKLIIVLLPHKITKLKSTKQTILQINCSNHVLRSSISNPSGEPKEFIKHDKTSQNTHSTTRQSKNPKPEIVNIFIIHHSPFIIK